MGPDKHAVACGATSSNESSSQFLQANKVWRRYGVSFMTINRWMADERIAFPRPVYLGRLRFWKIRDLEEWEANKAAARSTGAA